MASRDDKEGWFDDASTPPGEPPEPAEASSGDSPPTDPADLGSTGGPDGPPSDLDDIDVEAAFLEEGLLYAEAAPSQGATGGGDEAAEYRDALVRMKADFENYKKRVAKDHALTVERAAEKLVVELLPVLDACEAALGHGSTDVEPIYKSLLDTLEKGGLVRMSPEGQPFDPNLHEAVLHEEGDGGEIIVLESLRTGYSWGGRVLRPAMVKVRG